MLMEDSTTSFRLEGGVREGFQVVGRPKRVLSDALLLGYRGRP